MRTIESGPKITEMDVARFERRHGISLPLAYRSFLLATNGGRPERDLFPVPGFEPNPIARIHFFFGIDATVDSCNLEWNMEAYADRFPPGLLPVATTEVADQIFLALAGDKPGSVLYWDGYQESSVPQELYLVAASFEEFLEKLYPDEHSPAMTDRTDRL